MVCAYCNESFHTALEFALHVGVTCALMPLDRQWFKDDPVLTRYMEGDS